MRILRRRWFQIFVGGLVLLFLVERTLLATQSLNYVPSVLLLGPFLCRSPSSPTSMSGCRIGKCRCPLWLFASSGEGRWARWWQGLSSTICCVALGCSPCLGSA